MVTLMNAFKQLVADLDPMLHERGRLAIVSVLAAVEEMPFTELRDALGMTDGNLSVHLQKLEEKGYAGITKSFVGRRPHTTCQLTKAGQKAFAQYLDHLEAIVRQGRGEKAS
jgi:DNA-binding MarR family transcriptional regulator